MTLTQEMIEKECDELKSLLLAKNRKYGDSAINPKRIFSRASASEQIKVRLDDKLSRLMNQQSDEDEDVIQDLLGYLILYRIALKLGDKNGKIEQEQNESMATNGSGQENETVYQSPKYATSFTVGIDEASGNYLITNPNPNYYTDSRN